jgi:hypothetical protein
MDEAAKDYRWRLGRGYDPCAGSRELRERRIKALIGQLNADAHNPRRPRRHVEVAHLHVH